jgi:hypothetical protein
MSDLQYYPITLPGARLYPPDVAIRQLGPSEVENYYIIKKTASVTALRQLIGNTLKGVTIEELYEPDFLFTLYWHRVNSYMNFPYNLPWTCPACEDANLSKLDLTKIVSPSIPDDYPSDGVTLDLPCGLQMTFRLPKETDDTRASEQIRLLQIPDANEGHYRKAELLCMLEFDTNFDIMEKWDVINKIFTPEDIFVIDGFKSTFKFGPENIMDCKCSKCGADQKVSFRFSILEFFPSDTDKSAVRARILSSKPSKANAQRAKKDVLSKIAMAAQTPPKGTGGTGERQAGARIESVGDAEPATEIKEVPVATVRPNIHQTGNLNIPKVPANLAAKILEEAKHEVELEIEQDRPPGPASFKSIVAQK